MQTKFFVFVLLMGSFVFSCQNDGSPATDTDSSGTEREMEVLGYENVKQIEQAVEEIEAELDSLEPRGPINVSRGDVMHEVTAFYDKGEPVIIESKISNGSSWRYFLRNRRVIQLVERVPSEGEIVEHRFWYTIGEVLKAETRQADTEAALEEVKAKKYQSPEEALDFRLKVEEVNESAIKFLYGQ